jgi:AraC-like DNA-binding protein
MSLFDSSYLDAKFNPTSESHPAPALMNHPKAGKFHLTNIILFEKRVGPSKIGEHQHPVYHLVYFVEGKNEFLLEGERTQARRGTCILSGPDETHSFLPLKAGQTVHHAITFTFAPLKNTPSWADLLSHYTGYTLKQAPTVFEIPEAAFVNLTPLWASLRAALSLRGPAANQRIHFGVLQLFAFIADLLAEQQRQTLSKPRTPETIARDFLDSHYGVKITLVELARQSKVSPAHLSRAFKRRYGTSPIQYRDALRMNAAKNLLLHSDLLIKEIAYQLSYPDLFTFSKAFRRYHHCAPSAFRYK